MNRIFILTPLIVLLIICIFLLVYLLSGKDPNKPPSALLNKDVPIFESSSLYNALYKELLSKIGTSLFKSALGGLLGSLPLNK